jgi:hypothetical protein
MARCDDARPFLGPDTGPDAPGARDALILHHSCVSSTNGAYPPPFTLFLYDWCLSSAIHDFPLPSLLFVLFLYDWCLFSVIHDFSIRLVLILYHSCFSSTNGTYPRSFTLFPTIETYPPSFTLFLDDWCLSSTIHAFPL